MIDAPKKESLPELEKEVLKNNAKERHSYRANDYGYWLVVSTANSCDYNDNFELGPIYCRGTFNSVVEYVLTFELWTRFNKSIDVEIKKIDIVDLDLNEHEPIPYFDEQIGAYSR